MSSVPVFVGLDYHQDFVQVCVLDRKGSPLCNRSVENDARAIQQVATRYGVPRRIAVEACCGAADLAEELVTRRGLSVQLAHPGYVKRMKRSPDKTDVSDSQLLADLVRVNYLPSVWLAPRATRELRRLVRHRAQLVGRRKDVKLRIRGMLRENRQKCLQARAWTKAWYHWLAKDAQLSDSDRWVVEDHLEELVCLSDRIVAVEAKMQRRVQDDPVVEKLLTLWGVGLTTAVTLRAEIGRFDRFDTGKQLARFCGVTPRNASSGCRQADAGLIKAGNPGVRMVLIELAQRLMWRSESRWGKFAHDMLLRGKPRNVVVAAVANRWVRWLHHELRRNEADQPTSTQPRPKRTASDVSPIASI